MPKYLLTGAAGFIGFHTCRRLLNHGNDVVGVDNLNSYYSVQLKRDRLAQLANNANFRFECVDLADRAAVDALMADEVCDYVIHLAAQAGVRYSIKNPQAYIDSNLVGFGHVLEWCRRKKVKHLVYASSSSVYGANRKLPFSVGDAVDHPLSLYAATKKANELMAHAYSHLYQLPTTGLRFFTVYGPWGRPDMAIWLFVEAILAGRPIELFNNGAMRRDFTYIDDVVEAIVRIVGCIARPEVDSAGDAPYPGKSFAPFRLYNVGNNQPVELMDLVSTIERCVGKKAERRFLPLQAGDVPETYANIDDLRSAVGYQPETPIEDGVAEFVRWYRAYHLV